jgi:hypothetical protein
MLVCIKCGMPFDGQNGRAIKFDDKGHYIHEKCLRGEQE